MSLTPWSSLAHSAPDKFLAKETVMNNLRAVALCNNAAAVLVWVWDGMIPDCLGFTIDQIDKKTDKRKTMSSRVVRFEGESSCNEPTTTDQHPIQGCKWTDGTAQEGGTYQWEIFPMLGTPGNLKRGEGVLTNEVTLGFDYGPYIKACFNRGHLVSTQRLGDLLPRLADGTPDPQALIKAMDDPDSVIAKWLGASLPEFVKLPFEEAKKIGGHVFALFYELSAPAFVEYLRQNKDIWSLVFGNSGSDDERNLPARKLFHDEGADVTDRMVKSPAIAHNKSAVVVDKDGKPVKWMLQSVNPTPTGFYTQANHALMISSPELAAVGMDYWERTKEDCKADPLQSDEYRKANAKVADAVDLGDGTEVQAFFSPSTEGRSKPKTPEDGRTFPLLDMAVSTKKVKEVLLGAKQGIYFVAFYPGFPSFLDVVTWMQYKREDLPIRGIVSSPQALPRKKRKVTSPTKGILDMGGDFGATEKTGLGLVLPQGAIPEMLQVAAYQPRKKTPTIIAASALEAGWQDWHKELLKLPDAHAITHSKVIVVDPFGDDPWVLGAASDNLGLKAGFSNDETMLAIRGNRALAIGYFVHCMDVYNHFIFRHLVATGQATFKGVLAGDTTWQKKYLSGKRRKEYETMISGSGLVESD